jgi:uncharacterized protein YggE
MEKPNSHQMMAHKPFKKPLVILMMILLVVLIIFLGVLTWNAVKEHDYIGRSEQQIYTITITGKGKVTAIPDIATISLGVQTEKYKVVDAQRENTEKMNDIIKELKAMGIDQEDIKTTSYNIYPRYDWVEGQRILRGYQVSQNVTIKIRDLDKVGDVLDKAAGLGANQVGSLNFTIDEPEDLRQEAREEALAQAKEKAEALAKVAGVKLGKLVSFSETAATPYYPVYREMALDAGIGGGGGAPEIEPGSQEVEVTVTVTYEVL